MEIRKKYIYIYNIFVKISLQKKKKILTSVTTFKVLM